jgi:hypothetical protein
MLTITFARSGSDQKNISAGFVKESEVARFNQLEAGVASLFNYAE